MGAYIVSDNKLDMFNNHKDTLVLPDYKTLKSYEGKGNWAISRYYKFPFSFFYRQKLKLVKNLIGNDYFHNILDFGSGPGIFTDELKRHALFVVSKNNLSQLQPHWRFDAIVCASVLEFVDLPITLFCLKRLLRPGGRFYVSSPMSNFMTRIYFALIGNFSKRHHHNEIISEVSKQFRVDKLELWYGLYFSLRAR